MKETTVKNQQSDEVCAVSIVCTTYNQERYIQKALEGFLAQKTNFQFEIVIHDDASTDGTRAIVEQYVAAHPLLFKPVYQEVNQYSKGGFKPLVHAAGYARGKYLALCEGDDYWTNDTKLQQQYDALEQHPDLDFCFHSAHCLSGEVFDDQLHWRYAEGQILEVPDVLQCPTGTFAPTCSYMVRRETLSLLPEWFFSRAPVGDFFIEMYATRRGGALYIDAPMSVYRTTSDGSWHLNTYGNDEAFQKYLSAMIEAINLMEPDFPGLHDSFQWKRAWLYTFGAFHYLRKDNYPEFRKHIEMAFAESSFISNKQTIAYLLRRWPRMANRIIAVLSHLKHVVVGFSGK